MGASNRAAVFADFLGRQFPRVHTILDVAGGGGLLSLYLAHMGYKVTLVDPKGRISQFRGQIEHAVRLARGIPIVRKPFMVGYCNGTAPDLIVGMHPDGATLPIVEEADRLGCCFAVVPCCIKKPVPIQLHGRCSYATWVQFLRNRPKALDTRCTALKMTGRNLVVWGWPR